MKGGERMAAPNNELAAPDVGFAAATRPGGPALPSRPVRFLIVFAVVVAWWLLGSALHLTIPEYLLLGVPILIGFQLWVQREPLYRLWVRSGPPPRLDRWLVVLWILFSLFPAYAAARELMRMQLATAAEYSVAILGAFGLAYALRSMQARTWGYLGLCVLTITILGVLPTLLSVLLPHVIHIHSPHPVTAGHPSLLQSAEIGAQWFLLMPVGFVVEEVFFRGAMDTFLHRGEAGTGWLSAVFVSALWGLWHVSLGAHLLSQIVSDVAAQIIIGVPLSLWWRKSGNLVVNDSAHAVLEAVRNAVAGAGVF